MKQKTLPLLFAILFTFVAKAQPDPWVRLHPVPATETFDAFYFVDDNTGLLINYFEVFKTTDGGESWTELDTDLTAQQMTGFGNTVVLDPLYELYISPDAGETWNTVDFSEEQWELNRGVYLFSETDMIVFSQLGADFFINRSEDMGQSWNTQQIFAFPEWAFGFFAFDFDDLILSDYQALHYSGDGGDTWQVSNFDFDFTPTNPLAYAQYDESSLFAIAPGGRCIESVDRGANWLTKGFLPEFDGQLTAVDFEDENLGLVTTTGGSIFRTEDGGVTWTDVTPDIMTDYEYTCVHVNEEFAWIGGERGLLLELPHQGDEWKTNFFMAGFPEDFAVVNEDLIYTLSD